MRVASRLVRLALVGLCAALLITGCSTPPPPETPKASQLDAAIATASSAVSDASTYIFSLKQPLPDAPPNTDLEKLQTTLNAAAAQTGATQRATAQSALDQFNAGLDKSAAAAEAAPQDTATQDQFQQLIATLEVGRDALDRALK
jgi:hypothetical protein